MTNSGAPLKDSGTLRMRRRPAGFARILDGLPLGEWHGPVESGLGMHLIRLEPREEGKVPDLAVIRRQVAREWANERRLELRREVNEKLRSGYEIVIEWPESE